MARSWHQPAPARPNFWAFFAMHPGVPSQGSIPSNPTAGATPILAATGLGSCDARPRPVLHTHEIQDPPVRLRGLGAHTVELPLVPPRGPGPAQVPPRTASDLISVPPLPQQVPGIRCLATQGAAQHVVPWDRWRVLPMAPFLARPLRVNVLYATRGSPRVARRVSIVDRPYAAPVTGPPPDASSATQSN